MTVPADTRPTSQVHAVVFVVDGSDPGRLGEAKVELARVAESPAVVGKPVLV